MKHVTKQNEKGTESTLCTLVNKYSGYMVFVMTRFSSQKIEIILKVYRQGYEQDGAESRSPGPRPLLLHYEICPPLR